MATEARLSEIEIHQAQPKGNPYKLYAGGGLYAFISAGGGKSWRYDYRFAHTRQTLTLGRYPELSLEGARVKHSEARHALSLGINPAQKKREGKEALRMVALERQKEQAGALARVEELSLQVGRVFATCELLRRELNAI